MRADRLRERLDAGEVAYGVITGWADPDVVEAAGACGFDFVFIDAEHGALDVRTCADLLRAATCGGLTAIIRVPYADSRGVYNYLDAGAHGLIFPHVRSAADARAAVNACLYPPDGLRGALSASRAARYGTAYSRPDEYYRAANEATWVLPLVEDVEAIDALDDILAVPGIRGFFIGPGDLGLSRIASRKTDGPAVDALVDRAIERGVLAGKVVGTVAGTPAAAAALAKKGVRMICAGVTGFLIGAYRGFLKDVPRKLTG
jgi:2-keto-3-deoxy-L-rhamnonate aldolase RhmA